MHAIVLFQEITVEEISFCIDKLKSNSSPGIDDVQALDANSAMTRNSTNSAMTSKRSMYTFEF